MASFSILLLAVIYSDNRFLLLKFICRVLRFNFLPMTKILVTGGTGFIGSHTVVDLIENGYDVISVDNNSRSNPAVLKGVEQITGKPVKNYKVDLCNFDDTYAIFQENPDIKGIIHFAAYKAVGESVEKPLMYFENNLVSLINLLKCVQEFSIPYFVFSCFLQIFNSQSMCVSNIANMDVVSYATTVTGGIVTAMHLHCR